MSFKKNEKTGGKPELKSRRGFLKQVAYVTPTVVVLGALTKPTESGAASLGNPPSAPTWSN